LASTISPVKVNGKPNVSDPTLPCSVIPLDRSHRNLTLSEAISGVSAQPRISV
jgi:hypothetical protein